ncbi:MAG: hypothetical protein ACYDC0_05065 [Acidimicrobiales bacterium]
MVRYDHDPEAGRSVLRHLPAAPFVVAVTVLAAVAAYATLDREAPKEPGHHTIGLVSTEQCPLPATGATPTPHDIGKWPFRILLRGTFEDVSGAGGGRLLALQACGAEESSLRVVAMSPTGGIYAISPQFHRAAPIASAVVGTAGIGGGTGAVWFGDARLALAGPAGSPPYLLSAIELGPRHLRVRRTVALGRGYGLTLLRGPGSSVLVSTGRALFEINARGSLRAIDTFPGLVAQHVAVVRGTDLAIVSLYSPSTVAPASSTKLVLVNIATGHQVTSLPLPGGKEVESITATSSAVLVAVGDGTSTKIERFSARVPLRRLGDGSRPVPVTLTSLALASREGAFMAFGPTTMACGVPATGDITASTLPAGASQAVSAVWSSVTTTLAIVPAGLGILTVPRACR